jgi:hypothetical protein
MYGKRSYKFLKEHGLEAALAGSNPRQFERTGNAADIEYVPQITWHASA